MATQANAESKDQGGKPPRRNHARNEKFGFMGEENKKDKSGEGIKNNAVEKRPELHHHMVNNLSDIEG